jgi:hypothetical protein
VGGAKVLKHLVNEGIVHLLIFREARETWSLSPHWRNHVTKHDKHNSHILDHQWQQKITNEFDDWQKYSHSDKQPDSEPQKSQDEWNCMNNGVDVIQPERLIVKMFLRYVYVMPVFSL